MPFPVPVLISPKYYRLPAHDEPFLVVDDIADRKRNLVGQHSHRTPVSSILHRRMARLEALKMARKSPCHSPLYS